MRGSTIQLWLVADGHFNAHLTVAGVVGLAEMARGGGVQVAMTDIVLMQGGIVKSQSIMGMSFSSTAQKHKQVDRGERQDSGKRIIVHRQKIGCFIQHFHPHRPPIKGGVGAHDGHICRWHC